MKIRTDFVTNSSSSNFCLSYKFELKNGKRINYSVTANGDGFGEFCYITGSVSARQLGIEKSVNSMIKLLQDNTMVENEDELHPALILQEGALEESGIAFKSSSKESAEKFIDSLRTIKDMGEIKQIIVSAETLGHYGEECLLTSSYDMETQEYNFTLDGDEEIYEEEACGRLDVSDSIFARADYQIIIPITGTAYEGRVERIEHVKVGDKLILKADYNNEHFYPVAIEVFNEQKQTLGYLSDRTVHSLENIAPDLDNLVAEVASVTPLSARPKRSRVALMDVRIRSK